MADKTIKFLLVGEDKSASKTLKGLGDEAGKTESRLSKMGTVAGGVLTADLFKSAASAIVDFGKSSVTAFRDAEQSQRQLEDAYKRFPATADVSITKMRELNQAIQDKTGADADDLASSQSVLAQYGLTGKQIADLTPLLDDYAVKTGKDLPSAAEDLGKSMLGQGRALKNVGIDFQDTGSVAGNFEQVMGGLRTQVGGFAEGEAMTTEGRLRLLTTQFGDVQEAVGAKFLPVLNTAMQFLLDTAIPALERFGGMAGDAFGPLIDAAKGVGDILLNGDFTGGIFGLEEDSPIIGILFALREGFLGIKGAVEVMWAVVQPIVDAVVQTITTKWAEIAPQVDAIFVTVQDIITNVMSVIQSIITIATEAIKLVWRMWGDEILRIVNLAIDLVVGVFNGFVGIVQGVWQLLSSLLKGDTQGIMDGVKQIFSGAFDVIKTLFSGAVDALGIAWSAIKSAFAEPVNWVINNVLNPLIDKIKSIAGTFGVTLNIEPITPMAGYVAGGYTGPGGKYEFAGVVHADEFVVQSSSRRKFERENPGALDYLNATGMLPGYAIGGAVAGLDPVFLNALMAWSTASGYNGSVTSGYRSIAEQTALWNASDKSGKMVAAPGSSRHNFGTAADVSPYPTAAQAAMMAAFGIGLPMSYEPWHIQLGGSGSGAFGGSIDIVAMLKTLVGDLLNFTVPGGGVMVDIMKSIPGKVFDWGGDWLKGKLGFDNGGKLPPGFSMAYNGTGFEEYVLTAPQARDISSRLSTGSNSNRLHPDDLRELANILDRRPVRVEVDGRQIAASVRRHDRSIR